MLITLDEQDCKIALYERNGRMFLDLTVNGQVIQQGAIVQSGMGIIQVATAAFAGQLVVVDTGTQAMHQQPPRYEGLDSSWILLFMSAEEVAENQAAWAEQALQSA